MLHDRIYRALRTTIRWSASLGIISLCALGLLTASSPANASSLVTPSKHAQSVARAAAMSTSDSSMTSNSLGYYTPAGAPNPHAEVVHVGMYAVNAYDLDTQANTFQCEFYVWFRWHGSIDPTATFILANSVEEWGLIVTNLFSAPQIQPDGDKLMQMRVQGRFFQPYNLKNYPLDKQQLSVYVEDATNPDSNIVYVPDLKGSGFDHTFQIPGWNVKSMTATRQVHHYISNWGLAGPQNDNYAALDFAIHIQRSQNLFWWKLLLPILLVLITNWLALLLKPKFNEIRMAMPATALLTTVFLQQNSESAIPQVSTLVLMDYLYLLAYALIVVTFAQIAYDTHRTKEDLGNSMKIVRGDRISAATQFVLFGVFLTFLLISTI